MKRKLIAAMLACAILLSLLPTPLSPIALAVGETLISSRADLKAITSDPSGNYRLTADIDLAGESWTPLPGFSGKLDGGDHVIKNLSITDTNGNYKGLFASITGSGRVCNLGMDGVNITAGNNTGAIAGTNSGNISRCYTTGTVSGNAYAGGITGENFGTIENCYSRVSVSGKSYLGGLAGSNSGKITKSYAASTVTDSVMNNYLQFSSSGTGGYVNIPNNDSYKTDAFTLEAWFQVDSAGLAFIISKSGTLVADTEWFEIHTNGNGLRFIPIPNGNISKDTYAYGGDSWIDVKNVLKAGWFHVAAVYWYDSAAQEAHAQVYVNGEAQDLWKMPSAGASAVNVGKTATIKRSTNPLADEKNNQDISIGRRGDNSYYFNGKIADVRFWNTARTGKDILADKDRMLTGAETGLVGYWKLNDSLIGALDGQTVADSTGNGNSGTIHGNVTQTTATGTAPNKGALVGSNSGTGTVTSCFYDSTLYGSASGGEGTAKATADMKTQSTFSDWDFVATWKIAGSDYPNLGFKTVTSVSVTPVSPSVIKGSTQNFSATVTGANEPAQTVTWSVTGGIAGTGIDANGSLTVAAGETATTLTVKATSTVDTTKYGTATVTVQAQTYTIAVSPSTMNFDSLIAGYATAPTAQTLTITNNGNWPVNVDTSALSSGNYNFTDFSATQIAAGGSVTCKVAPKLGLAAGTYNASVTVSTTQGSSASFIPSFEVQAQTYTIAVTPEAYDFGTKSKGYWFRPAKQEFTVQNTGNSPVTLSALTGSAKFESVTPDNWTSVLAPKDTRKFTVQPNGGLGTGTYEEIFTVSTAEGTNDTCKAKFAVVSEMNVTISGNPGLSIIAGQSTTLTASITGGTAGSSYTYAWTIPKSSDTPFATTNSILVSPTVSTTYQVLVTEVDNSRNTATATITVQAATHGITVDPTALSFGTVNGAYTQPAAKTVTVTYTGNIGQVTLTQPTSTDYEIGALSTTTLNTGSKTATFTIRPKAGLGTGTYNTAITVATDQDSGAASVTPSFTINGAFSVNITGDLNIIAGESTTLTANAAGGSGTYTYQWFKDAETTAFSTANPVTVSPAVTTTYKVIAHDAIEDKSAQATVTVLPIEYKITQGQNGIWLTGGTGGLRFTANGLLNKFSSVAVDNTTISSSNYTLQSGSTIVTLNAEYLKTLRAGRHTLRITFTDGYAETYFTITEQAAIPSTGDGAQPALWLWVALMACAGLAAGVVCRRRRND